MFFRNPCKDSLLSRRKQWSGWQPFLIVWWKWVQKFLVYKSESKAHMYVRLCANLETFRKHSSSYFISRQYLFALRYFFSRQFFLCWAELIRGPFKRHILPRGHFFSMEGENESSLTNAVSEALGFNGAMWWCFMSNKQQVTKDLCRVHMHSTRATLNSSHGRYKRIITIGYTCLFSVGCSHSIMQCAALLWFQVEK